MGSTIIPARLSLCAPSTRGVWGGGGWSHIFRALFTKQILPGQTDKQRADPVVSPCHAGRAREVPASAGRIRATADMPSRPGQRAGPGSLAGEIHEYFPGALLEPSRQGLRLTLGMDLNSEPARSQAIQACSR